MDFIKQTKEEIREEKEREENIRTQETVEEIVGAIKKGIKKELEQNIFAQELRGYINYNDNFYFSADYKGTVPTKWLGKKTELLILRKLQALGFDTIDISFEPCYERKCCGKTLFGKTKYVVFSRDDRAHMVVHIVWK